MRERGNRTIDPRYILITFVAVAGSWLIHEFAHYGAGELLGNNMVMTLNACYPKTGSYTNPFHASIVSAAGPLITLFQAVLLYFLMKRNNNPHLLPFLLTCLYMRLLAGIISFINPNDEARVSNDVGLRTFTLPVLMIAILFYLVHHTCKTHGYGGKLIIITVFLIMLFSSILVLTDQALHIKLLN